MDNTQICVIGNGIFKLFRYTEGNLKQFAFQKLEPQNYLCQTWVSDERVVVGTDNGKLLLFEAGELKNEFTLTMQVKESEQKYVAATEAWFIHVLFKTLPGHFIWNHPKISLRLMIVITPRVGCILTESCGIGPK